MKQLALVFSIGVLCLLAFASLEALELTDDLVLAFSFEEGAGNTVKDLSQQGNNGEIVGSPSWVDGKLGKALHFDGATYVLAPHIPFNERDLTVQLWIRPEMNTPEEVVFSQHELNAANLSLHFRVYSTSVIRFGFYSNDLDSPPTSLGKNEWHNLTFTLDGSDNTRKIYIDGQEIASDVSASAYLGTTGDVRIGGWERPTKPENPFYQIYSGDIDEVRVWYRLLNEEEMIESMDTEMPVEPLGKIATTWGEIKFDW